jgi:spermidine synthase
MNSFIHSLFNLACAHSSEIFRDRGLVEALPQKWILETEEVAFELVEDESGQVQVEWITQLPTLHGYLWQLIQSLRKKVVWLQKIKTLSWNLHLDKVQDWDEWNLIWEYQHALVKALSHAHNSLEENDLLPITSSKEQQEQQVCTAESAECSAPISNHYDELDDQDDDLDYVSQTCDNSEWMEFNGYNTLWQKQTSYQHALFNRNNATGDTCMDIDQIVQICSCYRPHYHEFSANFPARFVDEVEKVLFVGGGDSMLLHEALKYPSLQKVVGLELDQVITRKSFQYFHTQPHFDDDRVEWWFGDATKSLLLLPKDYWGSFDLVLVDLSETAMALSVTDGLDVFDALALLLKPEGIMVKNELYIDEMSDVFDYTIQIKYDSPKICSQIMALGSNRVDFFHQIPKDHGIHNFLLQPVDEMENLFEHMHDYRKNDARAQGKCDGLPETASSTGEQGKSAGILHVLDIEKVQGGIKLEEALATAIHQAGLTSIATPTSSESKDDTLSIVVFNEGYIVGRSWPDQDYVAVGVNLWGAFHKFDSIQTALLAAFNTSSLSSFRVVVGGMYGSTTWKDDQPRIGPQMAQNRNCDELETPEATDDSSAAAHFISEVAIEEVLNNLLPTITSTSSSTSSNDKLVVGVVCGFENDDDCMTKNIMEKLPHVDKVLTFWACPDLFDLEDGKVEDEMSQSDLTKMFACEKAMITQLHDTMEADDLYFDVFVVDSSSPYEMSQIFNSIWNIPKYRRWYIAQERNLFIEISLNPDIGFRRNFLDRYRKDVRHDPAARAEFIAHFDDGSSRIEIGVVSVGDDLIFQSLADTERKIKTRLVGRHGEIDFELGRIHGAQWNFRENLEPREFSHDDYDGQPAKVQFSQQKPLGRETIFQLIRNPNVAEGLVTMLSLETLDFKLGACLCKLGFTDTKSMTFDGVGDGGLIVSVSNEGSALLTWDGRDHVDINLFSSFRDGEEKADSFISSFVDSVEEHLVVALRDDYPRGTGRVVNFLSDLS